MRDASTPAAKSEPYFPVAASITSATVSPGISTRPVPAISRRLANIRSLAIDMERIWGCAGCDHSRTLAPMTDRITVAVEVPLVGDERHKNWAKVVEAVAASRSAGWA